MNHICNSCANNWKYTSAPSLGAMNRCWLFLSQEFLCSIRMGFCISFQRNCVMLKILNFSIIMNPNRLWLMQFRLQNFTKMKKLRYYWIPQFSWKRLIKKESNSGIFMNLGNWMKCLVKEMMKLKDVKLILLTEKRLQLKVAMMWMKMWLNGVLMICVQFIFSVISSNN